MDYEVHCLGHVREHQTYHVNLLQAWREPEGWFSPEDAPDEHEPEIEEGSQKEKIMTGVSVTKEHQNELESIIARFRDVLNEAPG